MYDEQIRIMIESATAKLERGLSPEEARLSLYEAGIVDLDGNLTEPYKHLAYWNPNE